MTNPDRVPATEGYMVVDRWTGEQLFVWPDVGLVITQDHTGAPSSIGVMPIAMRRISLRESTASLLARMLSNAVRDWRAR